MPWIGWRVVHLPEESGKREIASAEKRLRLRARMGLSCPMGWGAVVRAGDASGIGAAKRILTFIGWLM
jgi:hypothetical protein